MKKIVISIFASMFLFIQTSTASTSTKNENDITSKALILGVQLGMTFAEAASILDVQINGEPEWTASVTRRWPKDKLGNDGPFEIEMRQCAKGVSKCDSLWSEDQIKSVSFRFMPPDLGGKLVKIHISESPGSRVGLRKTEILNMMKDKPQSVSITSDDGVKNYWLWGGIAPLPQSERELTVPSFGGRYVFVSDFPNSCMKNGRTYPCGRGLSIAVEDTVKHGTLIKEMKKRGML